MCSAYIYSTNLTSQDDRNSNLAHLGNYNTTHSGPKNRSPTRRRQCGRRLMVGCGRDISKTISTPLPCVSCIPFWWLFNSFGAGMRRENGMLAASILPHRFLNRETAEWNGRRRWQKDAMPPLCLHRGADASIVKPEKSRGLVVTSTERVH